MCVYTTPAVFRDVRISIIVTLGTMFTPPFLSEAITVPCGKTGLLMSSVLRKPRVQLWRERPRWCRGTQYCHQGRLHQGQWRAAGESGTVTGLHCRSRVSFRGLLSRLPLRPTHTHTHTHTHCGTHTHTHTHTPLKSIYCQLCSRLLFFAAAILATSKGWAACVGPAATADNSCGHIHGCGLGARPAVQ